MFNTFRAIVREGHIQLLGKQEFPDGTEVLVTPFIEEKGVLACRQSSLH